MVCHRHSPLQFHWNCQAADGRATNNKQQQQLLLEYKHPRSRRRPRHTKRRNPRCVGSCGPPTRGENRQHQRRRGCSRMPLPPPPPAAPLLRVASPVARTQARVLAPLPHCFCVDLQTTDAARTCHPASLRARPRKDPRGLQKAGHPRTCRPLSATRFDDEVTKSDKVPAGRAEPRHDSTATKKTNMCPAANGIVIGRNEVPEGRHIMITRPTKERATELGQADHEVNKARRGDAFSPRRRARRLCKAFEGSDVIGSRLLRS